MTDIPRHLRPTAARRNNTLLTKTKGAPSAKGSAAAARPVTAPRTTRPYSPGTVKTGVTGVGAVAIESTSSNLGSSTIAADGATVVGSLSNGGTGAAVVGRDVNASGEYCARLGFGGLVSGSRGVGVGYAVTVTGDHAGVVGDTGQALGNGSWAYGVDSGGTAAQAPNDDDMVFGTANHNVQVPGRFNVAPRTPSSSADTQGMAGDIAADDDYVYVKTSTGWKRAALATF